MPSTGYLPVAAADGPATVMNPELRKRQEAVFTESSGAFESDLSRRLFPADHSSINLENPPSPAGCQLGHFRIEEMIGRGGMGAVFRAIDERLDRVVALKVLAPNYSRDPSTVERFRNEAKAAARLDHENIARVFYTGEDRGVHFIAHEFVTGTNLRDLIRERGRLSPVEAVNYTLQMAAALRHTSSAGVVHRDIKPSNIIITPAGRAKLVDLGLARKEYSEAAAELTVAGTTLGTFDYISPEQAKDPRDVDVRSDIYSLGCTLYHMLTGEPPYPEGTFFKRLLDRHDKAPPSPALKAPGVSPELAAVVQRMMAAQPRMRYSSAESLTSDLMQIAGQLGLRGIQPEGLVWTHESQLQKSSFWERNLGLLVSAAALLLIVFAIERFSRDDATNNFAPNGTVANKSRRKSAEVPPVPRKAEKPSGFVQGASGKTEKLPPDRINKPTLISVDQPDKDLSRQTELGAFAGLIGEGDAIELVDVGKVPGTAKTAGSTPNPKTPGIGEKTPPTPASVPERPFTVLTNDGVAPVSYPTLEGACGTAENGHVVVLNFNGIRRDKFGQPIEDKPLLITGKSITIRAGDGFHPTIVFAAPDDAKPQMITVSDGKLNVINIGFAIRVTERNDFGDDNRWSLFTLQGADRLVLQGVHATLENPKGQTAALIEISPHAGPKLAKNMMMKKEDISQPDRFEITVTDSFFRCDSEFLAVSHPRAGSLEVRNSAVVLEQSLLKVACEQVVTIVPESARVDLKLQHATVLAGQALLNINTGSLPGSAMPVHVTTAKDNLFVSKSAQPFVLMTGNGTASDIRRNLTWDGEKNFYDRFKSLWTITPDDRTKQPSAMTFQAWQDHWRNREVDARSGEVTWKQNWSAKTASGFTVKDLKPDTTADNAPNLAATDGTVGAILTRIANPDASKRIEASTP